MSVALATPFTAPRFVKGNRRAWPRLVPDQLQWLQRVRLTSGPAVSILDLSLNGALFEIPAPLRPGAPAEFELLARDGKAVVTGHVLRTEVSSLRADTLIYRGACVFAQPLPWVQRMSYSRPSSSPAR